MKTLAMLLALIAPGILLAQQEPVAKPSPKPDAPYPPSAFAVLPPDEGSPFFAQRQSARFAMSQEGQASLEADTVATFPKSKDSPDSVTVIFTKFFTDMFASVRLGRMRPEKTTQNIAVEPSEFSLAERRELDATYTVRNNTKKLIRLDFNTTQRGFQFQEGIVIINPNERIEYSEKVATREMKPSETYTIKADVVGYPDYAATTDVKPSP